MTKLLPNSPQKFCKKQLNPTSVTNRTHPSLTRGPAGPYLQETPDMQTCRFPVIALALAALLVLGASCSGSRKESVQTTFTSADSLTDRLLQLQDSMLFAWNTLVNDDKHKFRSIHELLHKLMTTGYHDQQTLIALEQRLNGVSSASLNQQSINDATLVEEYDFATASLITELTALAKAHESFADDPTLRDKVQEIILVDQRVGSNRRHYDAIVEEYNRFLEKHYDAMVQLGLGIPLQEKPVFEIAAGE